MAGARDFGYVVEVAAIPRGFEHDHRARFVVSPDPDDRYVHAMHGGFDVDLRLAARFPWCSSSRPARAALR